MRWIMASLLALGIATAAAAAETVTVGASLEPRRFEDQHGQPHELDASVRLVIFHRDMDGGALAKQALADVSEDALAERGVAYVADISGMPRLVSRIFALPAMRRRTYPMWLDRDGTKTADLPSRPGRVTVVRLELLRVLELSFVESAAGLRAALGLATPPARAD